MPDNANSANVGRLETKRDELTRYLRILSGDLEIGHAAEAEEAAMLQSAREDVAQDIRRARRMLADVNCAIARWNLGEYGRCVGCDKPISAKRLAAIPEAARCLTCAVAEVCS